MGGSLRKEWAGGEEGGKKKRRREREREREVGQKERRGIGGEKDDGT
jgi:hypothetical protein